MPQGTIFKPQSGFSARDTAGVALMALGTLAENPDCGLKIVPCGMNYFHAPLKHKELTFQGKQCGAIMASTFREDTHTATCA
jgi:hypothetical protein